MSKVLWVGQKFGNFQVDDRLVAFRVLGHERSVVCIVIKSQRVVQRTERELLPQQLVLSKVAARTAAAESTGHLTLAKVADTLTAFETVEQLARNAYTVGV